MRVAITPLTEKTDTGSNSKNNDPISQKSSVVLHRRLTKCSITTLGDFPSLLSLSPEFSDLHVVILNGIYPLHGETNLTFLLQTKGCLE